MSRSITTGTTRGRSMTTTRVVATAPQSAMLPTAVSNASSKVVVWGTRDTAGRRRRWIPQQLLATTGVLLWQWATTQGFTAERYSDMPTEEMHFRGQQLPHTAGAWGLCCTAGSNDYYNQEQRPYSGDSEFYPGPYEYERNHGYQSSHNHTATYTPRSYYGHDRNVDMWDVLIRRNKSNCAYSPRHGYDCHGYSEFFFRLL